MLLLSTAYFPPIEYFAILAECSISNSPVFLDDRENYAKQSYRNRCRILTSQGAADLRVPIVHNGARKITEILVDYSTPWVRQTKYAIETAYSSSPFFEYYRDKLFAILDSHPATLWELNLALIRFFCAKIGINPYLHFTTEYIPLHTPRPASIPEFGPNTVSSRLGSASGPVAPLTSSTVEYASTLELLADSDYREKIHPKRESSYKGREYWQVFKEKTGFVPNLSIMDLLFNEGPESLSYLL